VVLAAEKRPRKRWVVWEEGGQYPNVIIELLSNSTALTDRGLKKQIYQDIFRTPDYFWFDPHSLEFQGFHLVDGAYEAIQPNDQGYLWSQQLGLYLGVQGQRLRYFAPNGELMPTPEESAEQAMAESSRLQAEAAQQQAAAERQRNAQLVAKLRELGVELD
jgi:Putative restriction endonuclease